MPGPADIFALGMLYSAITNMFTSTETEQTYTLHFAKSKKGKSAEVKGAEHTSNARKSAKNVHEKGQTRKQQVNRDKKRQSGWKRNK